MKGPAAVVGSGSILGLHPKFEFIAYSPVLNTGPRNLSDWQTHSKSGIEKCSTKRNLNTGLDSITRWFYSTCIVDFAYHWSCMIEVFAVFCSPLIDRSDNWIGAGMFYGYI